MRSRGDARKSSAAFQFPQSTSSSSSTRWNVTALAPKSCPDVWAIPPSSDSTG